MRFMSGWQSTWRTLLASAPRPYALGYAGAAKRYQSKPCAVVVWQTVAAYFKETKFSLPWYSWCFCNAFVLESSLQEQHTRFGTRVASK